MTSKFTYLVCFYFGPRGNTKYNDILEQDKFFFVDRHLQFLKSYKNNDIEKIIFVINNTTNNTTNIQYIINSPTLSSIDHLSFELQKDILDKGLNSLIYLIELVNFNKSVPGV